MHRQAGIHTCCDDIIYCMCHFVSSKNEIENKHQQQRPRPRPRPRPQQQQQQQRHKYRRNENNKSGNDSKAALNELTLTSDASESVGTQTVERTAKYCACAAIYTGAGFTEIHLIWTGGKQRNKEVCCATYYEKRSVAFKGSSSSLHYIHVLSDFIEGTLNDIETPPNSKMAKNLRR